MRVSNPFTPPCRVGLAVSGFVLSWLISHPAWPADPPEVIVPVRQAWTQTAIDVAAGQSIRFEAEGQVRAVGLTAWEYLFGYDFERRAGPAGTYLWPRGYATRRRRRVPGTFPLPAGAAGPHPAFCLIGKIGEDGPPFYVGRRLTLRAERAGRLWLGINDDDLRDNRGAFRVRVALDAGPEPPAAERPRLTPGAEGRPIERARVLLLYVDGLRPDVVHEMARAGFLPNIQRAFLEGGLECSQAFTTFPSNTLTANGALFTGLLPDRTGVKSQNQFERTSQRPRGPLSEWTPDWLAARSRSQPTIADLRDKFAPEDTHRFLLQHRIPTLDTRVGPGYRFTILPVAPLNPPPQWLHRALNVVDNPFAASVRIPLQLDRVNARYLIEELLGDQDARVIAAWFPMVDKVSHYSARGQFGAARRELAAFDRDLGRILRRLRQLGWDRSTYLVLVSDHGHLGGEQTVNRRANLARDFFHHQLGMNAKVVGQEWRYPGSDPSQFVFLDHQAWAQASIFLPKGSFHRGPWQRNTLAELRRYDAGPNRGFVDLLEALAAFTGPEWEPAMPRPVDLILVKLDAARVLVWRTPDTQAIIHRQRGEDGVDRYRYEPRPEGRGVDPLGYAADPTVQEAVGGSAEPFFERFHSAEEWLRVTTRTEYPDAVVGFSTFFGWEPPLEHLADARDPDLVVTAARGWSFRSDEERGTDHGSPIREAMRITLMVAGPNVRRGVLEEPQRIINVVPTVLEMAGIAYDPSALDGRAIEEMYE